MLNTSAAGRAQRLLSVLCLVVLTTFFGATAAHAEGPIADTYEFDGQLGPDGILKATETITFGDAAPDELTQRLALRSPLDGARSLVYEITGVQATIGGAAADAEVSEDGNYLVVKLDTSSAGNQPITISYEVSGATRTEAGATGELTIFSWRALQGLSVEVAEVNGTIRVGTPDLPAPDTNQHNEDVRIANNRIVQNAGTNLAGGIGLTVVEGQGGQVEPGHAHFGGQAGHGRLRHPGGCGRWSHHDHRHAAQQHPAHL